jgi:hypothetical protein
MRAAACEQKKAPLTLTAMNRSKSAGVTVFQGVRQKTPALLTSRSSRPSRRTVSATSRRASAGLATSARMLTARAPSASIAAAVARAPAAER